MTLVVEKVGPLVTVQARGRRGLAHLGVPPSGPLDELACAAAIAAVGGLDDDAAIEIPLVSATFRAEGELLISIDGEPPRIVAGTFEVPKTTRAVRYLAVRGGIDVPVVLASRATLPTAGLGGHGGRPLRRGDRLAIGTSASAPRLGRTVPEPSDAPLLARAAIDAPAPLVEAFFAATFRIDPRSDRTGTRLSGAPLSSPGERLSRPIAPGAVQVPPDGNPIVIGPDGPTTGGYPVVAVLDRSARAALARLRPGAEVRFSAPKTPP